MNGNTDELIVLPNVTVKWVSANAPDRYGNYSVTAVLDPEHLEQLEKYNLPIKARDDGTFTYEFRRSVMKRNGSSSKPIKVVDENRNDVTDVPNGAVCDIHFSARPWNVNGNSGTKGYIAFMVVKNSE